MGKGRKSSSSSGKSSSSSGKSSSSSGRGLGGIGGSGIFGHVGVGTSIQCQAEDTSLYCQFMKVMNVIFMVFALCFILYILYVFVFKGVFSKKY